MVRHNNLVMVRTRGRSRKTLPKPMRSAFDQMKRDQEPALDQDMEDEETEYQKEFRELMEDITLSQEIERLRERKEK